MSRGECERGALIYQTVVDPPGVNADAPQGYVTFGRNSNCICQANEGLLEQGFVVPAADVVDQDWIVGEAVNFFEGECVVERAEHYATAAGSKVDCYEATAHQIGLYLAA